MSGGSKPDPYHQRDPPKKKTKKKPRKDKQGELKSYRDAVKPKRIDEVPLGAGKKGSKKTYYYDCEHCGKEFSTEKRKKHKHAFHNKECQHEWQKYGKPPPKKSPEGRRISSEKHKKLWANPEYRERQKKARQKATSSPEYRELRSKIAKEVASRPEWKERQSLAQKGKKRPPEVGRKISKARMGHEVSDEARAKLAEANRGEKSSFYKDGRSNMRRRFYASWEWKVQSGRVREEDNYTCYACGVTQEDLDAEKNFPVHHVIPLDDWVGDPVDYPDFLLATLCPKCHYKSDRIEGAMKWPTNSRGEDAKSNDNQT
ncbi:MAG: HNH endonuclease [Candidatus Thorarchaeota archaeon]